LKSEGNTQRDIRCHLSNLNSLVDGNNGNYKIENNVNINGIKVAVVTTGFHHKGFNKYMVEIKSEPSDT